MFESTKDTDGRVADGRNAFYSRAVTFLKIQTGNTETLKNEDIENAAQTATGNFLDFFKTERCNHPAQRPVPRTDSLVDNMD